MGNPFFSSLQAITTQPKQNPFFVQEQQQSATPTNPFFQLDQPKSTDPWQAFQDSARSIAKERNYPLGVLLGQAALETGHGTSQFARERNNYFGYQAYDSDPNQAKAYATPEQSINDYLDLIQNTPRYSWAYKQYLQDKNPTNLLANIRQSGYATDPDYVAKITNLPEFQQE